MQRSNHCTGPRLRNYLLPMQLDINIALRIFLIRSVPFRYQLHCEEKKNTADRIFLNGAFWHYFSDFGFYKFFEVTGEVLKCSTVSGRCVYSITPATNWSRCRRHRWLINFLIATSHGQRSRISRWAVNEQTKWPK